MSRKQRESKRKVKLAEVKEQNDHQCRGCKQLTRHHECRQGTKNPAADNYRPMCFVKKK